MSNTALFYHAICERRKLYSITLSRKREWPRCAQTHKICVFVRGGGGVVQISILCSVCACTEFASVLNLIWAQNRLCTFHFHPINNMHDQEKNKNKILAVRVIDITETPKSMVNHYKPILWLFVVFLIFFGFSNDFYKAGSLTFNRKVLSHFLRFLRPETDTVGVGGRRNIKFIDGHLYVYTYLCNIFKKCIKSVCFL